MKSFFSIELVHESGICFTIPIFLGTVRSSTTHKDIVTKLYSRSFWNQELFCLILYFLPCREWYGLDEGYDETHNPFANVSAEYTKRKVRFGENAQDIRLVNEHAHEHILKLEFLRPKTHDYEHTRVPWVQSFPEIDHLSETPKRQELPYHHSTCPLTRHQSGLRGPYWPKNLIIPYHLAQHLLKFLITFLHEHNFKLERAYF